MTKGWSAAQARRRGACRVKKKGWFSVLQNLSWLTQLGLSLAAPPVLCLLGAGWLARRFSLGPWVYFAAIVLGLGAAACTFAEFVKMFRRKNGKSSGCTAVKQGVPGGARRPELDVIDFL